MQAASRPIPQLAVVSNAGGSLPEENESLDVKPGAVLRIDLRSLSFLLQLGV
jgi:hypothetical protein